MLICFDNKWIANAVHIYAKDAKSYVISKNKVLNIRS